MGKQDPKLFLKYQEDFFSKYILFEFLSLYFLLTQRCSSILKKLTIFFISPYIQPPHQMLIKYFAQRCYNKV